MGGYKVQLPSRGTMDEAFGEMPTRVKLYVRSGLTTLSKFPPDNLNVVIDVILESMQSGKNLGDLEITARLGISQGDAPAFIGALTLLATVASTREASAEQCVKRAKDTKLIDENLSDVALLFFTAVIRRRRAFQRALQVSGLSTAVLPSLTAFDTTVDARFGFEKGRISGNATVIVIHISTDARNQEIWLQVTRGQLEGIIKELEEALKGAEQVEKLIAQQSTTGE